MVMQRENVLIESYKDRGDEREKERERDVATPSSYYLSGRHVWRGSSSSSIGRRRLIFAPADVCQIGPIEMRSRSLKSDLGLVLQHQVSSLQTTLTTLIQKVVGKTRTLVFWNGAVWPHVSKFRHFGKFVKVLGPFLSVYIVYLAKCWSYFGKIFMLLWKFTLL